MATPQFVAAIIADIEGIAQALYDDLGYLGTALVANIRYDSQKAFDEAVTAGTYAVDTFEKVGAAALADYWATVKSQLSAEWTNLASVAASQGFEAAVTAGTSLLKNIDWRAVSVSLTGIAEATLATTARATIAMLISGVLASA